jgi:carboxyl-terminal processing protease
MKILITNLWLLACLLLPTAIMAQDADEEAEEPPLTDDGYKQIQILMQAMQMVRQNYVDEHKVSYERLIESALEGMFASLDPHSQYMHRRLFNELSKSQKNAYDGVGIAISFKNEVLKIVSVREDGPAASEGLLPGDEILKIGETLVDQLSFAEASNLLSGKPGQTLELTIRRPATKEVLEFGMTRGVLQDTTIKDAMFVREELAGGFKIGYCRLLQFNEPSARELANALDELEEDGMQAFVLDLRNNPGGLLSSAVDVCGEFVPAETTIVTTEGRIESQNPPPYKTSANKRRDREYPLAILVNSSSASGSEVVAGALQDLKRAIIVGETTFGKGSVQSIIPMGMGTGAAMRLTTAKYYTPSHKTIHETGVAPNIVSTLTPDEEAQLARWRNRANLSAEERAELEKFHDRQLSRCVDALKAVLVYKGIDKK